MKLDFNQVAAKLAELLGLQKSNYNISNEMVTMKTSPSWLLFVLMVKRFHRPSFTKGKALKLHGTKEIL